MRTNKARSLSALALILVLVTASCSLFLDQNATKVTIESLAFSSSTLSLGVGGVGYLSLTVQPSDAKRSALINYTYDESVISVTGDSSGATVSGRKNGNTVLIANSDGSSTACVVTVSGVDPTTENAPHITTTTPIVELESGTAKKIIVTLSQGSSADMARFSWSIDKSTIASVEASGQNGIITAKSNGVARITITHPESTYPLEILVFVKPDIEKAVYLTTSQNIISIARDGADRKVSISLVNGDTADLNGFTWQVLNSEESNPACISLTSNGTNAEISPKSDGRATIRITHPKAPYPLDIKVRIVTIIENVYIDTPDTRVTVSGTTPTNLSVALNGSTRVGELDPAQFQWTIDDSSICEFAAYHNNVILTGKKNGIAKLTITHPAAKYPREIMVFVENQTVGAVNSGAYITTSQNYIRTKKGMTETELTVTLVGGDPGDEKDFVWSLDKPDVIGLRTTNGTTDIWSRAVSILTQRTNGSAFIEPLAEGTAVIYISHPKVLTPTEVLVKVYSEYASFENPMVIQGPSIIGLVRGSTQTTSLTLQGSSSVSDEAALVWKSENESLVTVSGAGKEQLISAIGNGQTFVTITHPKADTPKKILCYVAETAAELDAVKVLYTEKPYYSLVAGTNAELYLSMRNVTQEEVGTIQWQTNNASVATVSTGEDKSVGIVAGISSGTAIISATLPGNNPVRFTVTVYPAGTNLNVLPPAIYFTTGQNVVQFTDLNVDKVVSVTPVNLPLADYTGITWVSDKPDVITVVQNGKNATITSKSNGEAKITISHPKSENTLVITVRIGQEFIIVNPKAPFISTSKDVVGLVTGAQGEQITAKLENDTTGSTLFSWNIDNPTIATISPLGNKCFIIPKTPGQAQLTIRHANATYDKNVLILVGNTQEDIEGLAYLTTTQNVVRMVTGTEQTISIKLAGTPETSASAYTWQSDNPPVIHIVQNGNTAVFSAMQAGVARVKVTHTACTYPLELTVIVTDTLIDAAKSPYITSGQNILTVTKGGISKSLTVTLAGGTEADNPFYTWTVDRGDLIHLTSNGQNAVVKGISTGECRLTVTHPKAIYPLTIVTIVEEPVPSSSLYITPSLPIVSMKPAAAAQTVTATLVGGTAEDKYGFTWSADNYNVIDLTYASNMAIITPRQEGKAEITITHPKSPYSAKIIVRVTEYTQFSFSQTSMTIPEGTTQFVTMQVPAMEGEYTGRVTYQTDNDKIVTISGTNKVAQVTALATGTATVTATSPSGIKSDLMIYVKKSTDITSPYITSLTNVLFMKVTDSQLSVNASIVGAAITTPDQYNLQWNIVDPTIATLIGTSGSNILVKPLKAGETAIKITHPKTDTIYSIHVQVEGSVAGISLTKTYIASETGKTQEISALIDNGTAEDYKNIIWKADKVNGEDIISILGSGKTVALYALASGQTTVSAEFNGKIVTCDVQVTASRQFSFDTQTIRIQPGQTKTFKYTLVPSDAVINWMTNSNDFVTYDVDTMTKTVSVTGISEGVTKLSGTANSLAASINITSAWDYKFNLNKTQIKTIPRYDPANSLLYTISYDVSPSDANIDLLIDNNIATYTIDKTKKEIYIRPTAEGVANLTVTASNPYNNYKFGTQICSLDFSYSKVTIKPVILSKEGNFSNYDSDSGVFNIGDGESLSFKLSVEEENANYTLSNIQYVPSSTAVLPVSFNQPTSTSYKITQTQDYIEQEYKVINDTFYTWDNTRIVLNWCKFLNGKFYVYLARLGDQNDIYLAVKDYNYPYAVSGGDSGLYREFAPTRVDATQHLKFNKILRAEPLWVTQTDFKKNTDYYIPSMPGRLNLYNDWASPPWDYNTLPYFLNDAQLYDSIDIRIISSVTAGYISGTIVRSTGNQAFQIPVIIETRRCPKM